MSNREEEKFEQRMCFVAKYYCENKFDTKRAWQQFASGQAIRKRVPLRRYMASVAAVLLLLIGLGSIYLIQINTHEFVIIRTLNNQIKEIYLPDNTLITLSDHSEIRYDLKEYNRKRRAVEMKGKAFFQVAPDKARSFSVKTKNTLTIAVGTRFQIDEQKEVTRINVVTGRVLFGGSNEEDGSLLTADMSADYIIDNQRVNIVNDNVNTNYLSWKTHILVFNETPLEKVIEDVSKHFKVLITNKSNNTNLKLTATFNHLSLDETLSIINQTLDIQLVVVGGQ
jgi:ferric-dicitrate binding protein FerR (iron transport regulator)